MVEGKWDKTEQLLLLECRVTRLEDALGCIYEYGTEYTKCSGRVKYVQGIRQNKEGTETLRGE